MTYLALCLFVLLGSCPTTAPLCAQQPQPVEVFTGGAAPGQPDPTVTYLQGPATSGFGQTFVAADFQAARTGPQAQVRAAIAAGWPRQLPLGPQARWIDTQGGSASALYAIPFQLGALGSSAVLTMQFSADDTLGEVGIAGVYVNEIPVERSERVGSYYYVETLQRDVSTSLQVGQNWLYVYLHNTGGAGGLLFWSEIQIDGGMIATYGSGCAGSAGTPLLLGSATSVLPGSPVSLDVYSVPAGALVAMLFGSTNRTSFGQPTPADLAFLGYAGCSGLLEPVGLTVVFGSGGAASYPFGLPGPAFLGQSLFAQAFVFDSAHPRGASVSNGLDLRAGY